MSNLECFNKMLKQNILNSPKMHCLAELSKSRGEESREPYSGRAVNELLKDNRMHAY